MDLSSLVRAVIAAFEDATKLVRRIRDHREDTSGGQLPEEPTRDLLESLALGPVIVRGHYEHDLKRFGEQYACGDIQAREQMKDVLINLQMTLIITLRTVYMDDMELDFHALQTASDDCRANAGVCLGQWSQRLSDAVKAQAFYPPNTPYPSGSALIPPISPSLGYSSSRSTQSSSAFPGPRTPDTVAEQFGNLNISPPTRPPYIDRKMSTSSGGSQELHQRQSIVLPRPAAEFRITAPPVGVHRIEESDSISMRRRSSQALAPDDIIWSMFPQPGGQPILPAASARQDTDRESYVSSGKKSQSYSSPDIPRASSGHHSQNSRDRYGPDDYGESNGRTDTRQNSYGTIYDMYRPTTPERQASTSYPQRVQASGPMDHIRYLQGNSRAPRPQPKSASMNTSKKTKLVREEHHRPVRAQTDSREYQSRPSEPSHQLLPSPPVPNSYSPSRSHAIAAKHLSPASIDSSDRAPSIRTVASSTPSVNPPINTGPLTLPTDKNLLGFCKGAFRLQAGLERKAFSVANRPAGFASMITYWKCEKCNFEGPMYSSVNLFEGKKKGKPERLFDPKVRTSESGGIRYRWTFLARCHVALKGMVPSDTPAAREGSFGSFGCIFCCAEGKNRGWLDAWSNASVRSGNTAIKVDGTNRSTPIFGNVTSFMEHLETLHRKQDGWPNAEMIGRFRVVVGTFAASEDNGWEVNFVPY
ncbi:uncharacterized protein Z518_08454 [Rhinocladiella mackenziei CBS 650.93]|uniref:Rhinocladiella mackenziei CBS 650.93 unplaced genomic scaffold supercont1.6, whole genome shotgun sequence n=1 Tax=Rhinocladiella mackenziei CBS 650.93 TaxID=1442369 RepID=A0A0D2GWD5_9EURO|nr:uncharacterized protein Z518_08454 [Rhinocladiella mackenziei CBS 650.93]KIX02513.1 hypothetical protein Z518_08454 [Rhinocladiella mackenziei CBS 650.93]